MKNSLLLSLCFLLCGCGKSFLDVKSNRSDRMPNSIDDYQALMDNVYGVINMNTSHLLGIVAGDEIAVDEAILPNFKPFHQRNAYLWVRENFFEGEQSKDWNNGYRRILYCNQVLDGLDEFEPSPEDRNRYDQVQGSAYFFRALSYYQLAQLFCEVYSDAASSKLGLPLRTEADITLNVKRSNLEDTYDFIFRDLEMARERLPEQPAMPTRPSKTAADAFLARIYLQLGDYENARDHALQTLSKFQGDLLDYNLLANDPNSFDLFVDYGFSHPEVILFTYMPAPEIATLGILTASAELLQLYDDNDLRRDLFFRTFNDAPVFVGTYSGMGFPFTGFALDEIILILAECEARGGNHEESLAYLNALKRKRYLPNTDDFDADTRDAIMKEVLLERRRQLLFRGVRWEDIRRLNKERTYPVTIKKKNGAEWITIEPNDTRYVFPLPENAVELGGLEQNPR